tara:strand:- start:618 stop:1184 length:567 start_codon:yes stop_codon:yes gene_type:complete
MEPIRTIGAVALLLAATACSGTKKIANSANHIRSLSLETIEQLEEIKNEIPAVEGLANAGIANQEKIIGQIDTIQATLPSVEDQIPSWMRMVIWVAVAICGIVGIVLLWQTGVGFFIRQAFMRLGYAIPKKSKDEAKLLRKVIHGGGEKEAREAVAYKRAADPAFDAAWRTQTDNRIASDGTVRTQSE